VPNRIGDRTLEGGEKGKNKTRGNEWGGEERENRRGRVVAAGVGIGVGTGTANSGAVG